MADTFDENHQTRKEVTMSKIDPYASYVQLEFVLLSDMVSISAVVRRGQLVVVYDDKLHCLQQ